MGFKCLFDDINAHKSYKKMIHNLNKTRSTYSLASWYTLREAGLLQRFDWKTAPRFHVWVCSLVKGKNYRATHDCTPNVAQNPQIMEKENLSSVAPRNRCVWTAVPMIHLFNALPFNFSGVSPYAPPAALVFPAMQWCYGQSIR